VQSEKQKDRTNSLANHRLFTLLVFIALSVIGCLLLAEVIIYPGVVQKNLFIPPLLFGLFPVFLRLVFPQKTASLLPKRVQSVLPVITSLIFLAMFLLTLADYFVYRNYIYSTLSLHPAGLIPLAVFLAVSSYTFVSAPHIKKRQKLFLFFLPFWLFCLVFPFRWLYPEAWTALIREDSVVEYLTMGFYALASLLAFSTLSHLTHRSSLPTKLRIPLVIVIFVLGLACFLIAGDEISWGQRLLGIETPQELAARNTQQELNLHNNRAVFGYIYIAYGVIAFLGMTAWLVVLPLQKFWPKSWLTKMAALVIPPWTAFGFFLPTFLFTRLRSEPVHPEVIAWEETSELFLAAGIMVSVYWILVRVKRK